MAINNITLKISNISYNIEYPFSFSDTGLEGAIPTGEVKVINNNGAPFKPNERVEITTTTPNKSYFFFLLEDRTEKLGATNKHRHNLLLIDAISKLKNLVLPDMTITRYNGVFEPNLSYVADKILRISGSGVSLSTNTRALLNQIAAPELTFTRYTVYEAIEQIFAIGGLTPKMANFSQLTHYEVI